MIKLKDSAPWPSVKLPSGLIVSKTDWIVVEETEPGLKGIEHLLEYKQEETDTKIKTSKKTRTKKNSIELTEVPDLPTEK